MSATLHPTAMFAEHIAADAYGRFALDRHVRTLGLLLEGAGGDQFALGSVKRTCHRFARSLGATGFDICGFPRVGLKISRAD
jgi:hypothetical protein